MSKKTLNEANLTVLGAERLAQLLIEVSTGSAEIKRRLRLELSHNLGPEELARDVQKRLTSIRRSTSFVGWRKRKALIKDLNVQAAMITDKIAPEAPTVAFDLLWDFIELSPSVYQRVDDSRGDISDVFHAALIQFADIGPRAVMDPENLAVRIWDALRENSFGEFDGIIGLLAVTLGDAGLEHLKTLVQAHEATPVEASQDHAALQFLRDLRSSSGDFGADQKARLLQTSLQQIAIAQGDIDAFIAQYSPQELHQSRIATKVAQLLLNNERAEAALDVMLKSGQSAHSSVKIEWDFTYIQCLLALERMEDAQNHRWACFCDTLNPQILRDFLKVLPDFEDIEAEDEAKAHVLQNEDAIAALQFFLAWPDLGLAAKLIETRRREIDGELYQILTPAAENLRDRHPLAAVILWRAIIEHTLWEGRASRYGHAVDHLMDCEAVDAGLTDYGQIMPHHEYVEALRTQHKHKSSFWAKFP